MKKHIILWGLLWTFIPAIFAAETEPAPAAEPAAEETDDSADLQAFLSQFSWTQGPATGKLGDVAELNLPEGFRLANGDDTRKIMAAFGNLTSDQELGLVAPDSFDWFIVFEFDPVGYVKDDEKDDLKPDEMMDSIKRGTEFANEERAKMGIPGMTILGWQLPPRYNDQTKLLEWSIRAESEGSKILNHNTRILGRHGVMEAALVVDPEDIEATLPVFYSLLEGYGFQSGQKYAEYQDGDKIAKYGLAALIVGGGAAAAAKLGLFAWLAVMFKKLWKLIVVAVVGIGAWFKKLVGGGPNVREDPS